MHYGGSIWGTLVKIGWQFLRLFRYVLKFPKAQVQQFINDNMTTLGVFASFAYITIGHQQLSLLKVGLLSINHPVHCVFMNMLLVGGHNQSEKY